MDERAVELRLTNADWPTPGPAVRSVLDGLPAAAYMCDVAGYITYFNARARELWGRAPALNDPGDRFCGSWRLFSVDGESVPHSECWMAHALRDGVAVDAREIVIERQDGERRRVLAHVTPIRDENGSMLGAMKVMWDITERARAELKVRNADRRRDEFLATLAHELRNPLAPLRAGVAILQKAGGDAATLIEHCELMERQLQQLTRVVDDLLEAADVRDRTLQLHRGRLDLRALVRIAVEQARDLVEAADHRLIVQMPETPVHVEADPLRIGQVLSHLLGNAVKYTRRGGRIDVTTGIEGGRAWVSIRDNGLGIPVDKLDAIFEMFRQLDRSIETGYKGLGLGLHLVRELAEMHGGTVEAASDGLGSGSVFTLTLPVLPAPAAVSSPAKDAGTSNGAATARCRVLLVDDNRDVARSMARLIRLFGHEVRVAFDGREAVSAAAEFRPCAVLMDIGLPTLNGYDAAREMRSHDWGAGLVLVAITGWGREMDRRQAREAGFDHHLTKPVEPGVLETLLTGCRTGARAALRHGLPG